MAGGILDLVATGSQDIILIGNPEKTFFKAKYSKYTNFGMQKFRIDYNGLRTLKLTDESVFKFKIPKYADLLMDTYVVVNLPHIWSPIYPPQTSDEEWRGYDFQWIKNLGTQMIKEISISACGQLLQKYSGSYIQNMVNRDYSSSQRNLFDEMTGNAKECYDPSNVNDRINTYPNAYYTSARVGSYPSINGRKLYIPINTWFSQSSKMAFPLSSLYNNDLHITVTLRPISELFTIRDITNITDYYPRVAPNFTKAEMGFYRFLQTPPSESILDEDYADRRILWNADVHLYSTYCFLSEDEGELFKSREQQYLIKVVHEHVFNDIVGTKKLPIDSTGLVSNWMFTLERNDIDLRNEWSNYTNWAYDYLPLNVTLAVDEGNHKYLDYDNENLLTDFQYGIGAGLNPNGEDTGLFITDVYTKDNEKKILQEFGIVFDGQYRENLMDSGIYEYIEPHYKSKGTNMNGLYTYNFSLNSNPFELQPSGAVNLTMFKKVELEVTTFTPSLDENAQVLTVCDADGVIIGINKPSWIIYDYTYTLRLYEEKYNILTFNSGNCGYMFVR
uniref:Major capsid protein N-terminal domain-containing protein n=1 Tax=viral metagenome TaxID=1070528 RepID=A0A6C0LIT3_9ZZZZ